MPEIELVVAVDSLFHPLSLLLSFLHLALGQELAERSLALKSRLANSLLMEEEVGP